MGLKVLRHIWGPHELSSSQWYSVYQTETGPRELFFSSLSEALNFDNNIPQEYVKEKDYGLGV
jgi:hypothetical protein